ncbi:MAG: IS66 family transposase [Acidimicrobiales bacterium]
MEFDEPTYEELKEQLAALELVVTEQEAALQERDARIAELEARLSDLEERLGRNPRNSSMPPSAEGLSKPPASNRQQRRAEARRQGKQPGAEGKHLAQVADPDEVVVHAPPACPDCGADLADAEVLDEEVRQVFDFPEIRPHVTEHRLPRLRCGCGCEVKATAPREATAPACYGYGVRALACYLAVHQHLPYDRMAKLFSDVLGIEISTGALAAMVSEGGGMLGLFSDTVRDLLADAPAINFDETGGRVAGSLHWVHVACSSLYTLLECHKRRGTAAMDEMGVIEKMRGIAVHDGWKPYRSYDVSHQLCNAHHLRELERIGVVWDQGWANNMIDLLVEAKEAVEKARAAGHDRLEPSVLHSIRVRYGMLVAKGWAANPAPEVGKRHGIKNKAANLLVRLDGQRDDVLRFATDFRASWDNNQAERDVRMVKLQQKISGSWRTLAGARAYCAIRGYISTMRKHDVDILDGLRNMFEGQVWLPVRT